MTNKQVARMLRETGQLIELAGGNPFRARAFEGASRTVERIEEPIADVAGQDRLTEIRGIGSGLALQICEILDRGSFELRDELLSSIPPGVIEMLRVKGLGAKKVRRLWKDLEIITLEELEMAAAAGRLAETEGFGRKTEQSILENIERLKRYRTRRRFAEAFLFTEPVLETLRRLPSVEKADMTGDIRRNLETVPYTALLIAVDDRQRFLDEVPPVIHRMVLLPEDRSAAAVYQGYIADELPIRLYLTDDESFAATQWRLTGSAGHVDAFISRFGEPPGSPSEEKQIYAGAGLSFIPPDLRENDRELDDPIPELITVSRIRGLIHNHSTYSDGAHTLRMMAEATRNGGYDYFGINDHSRSLTIANGLSVEEVHRQCGEVELLNEEFARDGGSAFRIFSGIESDILTDGSLDYPDEVLATLDLVVASIHSRFRMPEAEMTARMIRAIENPYTRILGHPTGRQLLIRDGYEVDLEKIIDACAANGVAIELNANPYRLDIDWRWIRRATDRGVLISINPDAHTIEELEYVEWGTRIGRKGWLTAEQCLNAKSLQDFADWVESGRA